jgi:hypothetical protein
VLAKSIEFNGMRGSLTVTSVHDASLDCPLFQGGFMQIQVNASNGIENKEALERWADSEIKGNLSRFVEEVTRVEVHMSGETAGKSGGGDKRCTMEARLAHHQPVVATHDAPSQDEAFRGALTKLKRVVEHTLARIHNPRDRDSIRKDVDVAPE